MANNSHNSQKQENKPSLGLFLILKRVILSLLLLVVLSIGAALAILFYKQNEIKSLIISEVNKNLKTEIIVNGNDIDFTFIKTFPFASLNFKNVKALDATDSKKKDTLFRAKEISMLFNLLDVYNKKYQIKKLKFENADLNIKIDKNGNDNYHFWKSTPDTNVSNFKFSLEDIELKQVHVDYKNYQNKSKCKLQIIHSNISGEFSNEEYSLEIKSNLFVNSIKSNTINLLRSKQVNIDMLFNVDNTQQLYTIDKGRFKIEDVLFESTGTISTKNKTILNIVIEGKKLDIRSVLSLIPDKYKKGIDDYKSEGEFYFKAKINGGISNGNNPNIRSDFGINNSTITHNDVVLNNVNLKGSFSNGKKGDLQSCELTLQSFKANFKNGLITGELTLKDFENLFVSSKINASLSLEELQDFVKADTIESISGSLKLNIEVNGKWDEVTSLLPEKSTVTGTVNFEKANLKLKENPFVFSNINGNLVFDNNTILINTLSGSIDNSDFLFKGIFKNVIGFLFKENQTILMEADLTSKKIDLNELLKDNENTSTTSKTYKLKFSEFINVKLNSKIENLIFRKFEAKNIKGNISINDKKMKVDSLSFSTMDGLINAVGIIDGTNPDKLFVTCFSDIKNINITKMFIALENFGQENITDKNIKGIANAKIQLKAPLSNELQIETSKVYAIADMTIDKGELNNVEAMKSLSRFVELNELMNVKFETLKNQIEIKNQTVYFPKMEIRSNALNITTSGTHTFNNEINYKIKLSLDELLGKKAKKNKKENDEFGEIAKEDVKKTNLFLTMTGTAENPIIKYDSKEAIVQFKENLNTEKQTVKSILKEELGLFKKDTSLNSIKKKEEPVKFNIEWEETKKKKTESKELKPPPKKVNDDEDF